MANAQDEPQASPDLTLLEYALLGLVDMAPLSGYDVTRVFASTPLAHFSSSPGAIYPALKRLERRGLMCASLDTARETRPRRPYRLTESGAATLDAWLHRQVTRDELVRDGGGAPILRFSLAEKRLSRGETLAYLAGYGSALRGYLANLEGYRQQFGEGPGLHARLALEHGIMAHQAGIQWVENAISALEGAG